MMNRSALPEGNAMAHMEEDSEDEDDSGDTDRDENKNCTCDGAQQPCISDQKTPDNRDHRGSLGPGFTGVKSGCGPVDQGFENRFINGSKPFGLRTRLVNNQEIFDVNVAVLVELFIRDTVGTAEQHPLPNLYSIGYLLFFFLMLHDSLNNKP
ncbi:hypothetical protein N7481_001539 [Penicillium waksmanii]|uniref:uncharacterized protein n=1 Tax=Penicillium waksmanii TaxID=69791 RepID=UPI00254891BA|nr:uncharacterized protein N7481_001539 [Penicillium waksmanii]KAJ6001130.1 hypothetical protein N7481_001539 [Penicillium waksmanii]